MNKNVKGTLEIICGSMFSGKSEELIRRLKREQLAKKNVIVFKHSLDKRISHECIASHNGATLKALPVAHAESMISLVTSEVHTVGIDEVQFFSNDVVNVICTFIEQGKRVIAAGLDLDFKQVPFGPVPLLLAVADSVTKLKAICMQCGKDAHSTQRLIDERPANFDDPIIMVGAQEKYQARCRDCYTMNKQPIF